MQQSPVFLYTNNEQSKKDIFKNPIYNYNKTNKTFMNKFKQGGKNLIH